MRIITAELGRALAVVKVIFPSYMNLSVYRCHRMVYVLTR